MTAIKSEVDFEKIFMPKIKQAVEYLVQEIWKINREVVQKVVYDAYEPEFYDRTNEFKEAWSVSTNSNGNYVEGKFFYDPRILESNPETGQHASFINGEPMTTYLADIIYQGLAGDFTGRYKRAKNNPIFAGQAWTKSRNAWSMLEKELGAQKLKNLMKECFIKAGLSVTAHGRPWSVIKW